MESINFTELDNRALLRISGGDATTFLQGLVTCDVGSLKTGEINFGALLSPQGKILFDFFIIAMAEGYMVDIDRSMATDFTKRLMFYRLRANVDIQPMDQRTNVFAIWGDNINAERIVADGIFMPDPRLTMMGMRGYLRRAPEGCNIRPIDDWNRFRISLGMPQGGHDFAFGNAFPHEALMDQFKGVDFKKGCYVGQEVVSRMQHRSSARKRLIQLLATSPLPEKSTEILCEGKTCGEITSTAGTFGMGMVRIDKPVGTGQDRIALAATTPVTLHIPDWCNFSWQGSIDA